METPVENVQNNNSDKLGLMPAQNELTVIPVEPPNRYDLGYAGLCILHTYNYYSVYSDDGACVRDYVTLELHSDADGMLSRRTVPPVSSTAEAMIQFEDVIKRVLGETECVWLYSTLNDLPPWERTTRNREINAERHTFNEEGAAARFEDECRGWFVYDMPTDTWYAWIKNHYEPAAERLIQAARFVGRTIADEEPYWEHNAKHKEYQAFAKSAAGYVGLSHMLKLAAANMSVDLSKQSDLTLMACKNGIINRKTGEFVPLWNCGQYKSRLPTVYVDCEYNPHADAPAWRRHIELVMTDNTSGLIEPEVQLRACVLSEFLHRLFGYALYAGNPERLFVFFWGKTTNGKSTTINILSEVFGEQASNPPLTQLYSSDKDVPTPAIVDALPKTLAFFSEASGDTHSTISVASFKEISGDAYSTKFRRMHQNNVKLPIMCLPIGVTNDLPSFDRPDDAAVLKRMVTIPFRHMFETENRNVAGEILKEKDGIFSICVNELRKYLEYGLPEIPSCAKSTQLELLIGSTLYGFIRTNLIAGRTPADKISRKELKDKYIDWCLTNQIDEVVIKYRYDGESRTPELARFELNRLYSAMRIMKIEEFGLNGKRYFRASFRTNPQDTLF